jgi:hypothetical protein
VDLPETGQTFSYTFNAKVVGPAKQARREFVERHLRKNYPALVGFGLVAGFVCLLLGGRPHRVKPAGCCLLLAAGWFTSRALFDGLLDTDFDFGYSGPARFMQWVSPVFILILFLAGALAAGFIRSRMRPPEPGPESKPGGGGV